MIWFDIAWPQWMERNRVAKGHGSNVDQLEMESELLKRKLVWYCQHRHELLPIHQQQLANLQLHEIIWMRPATRRSWLHHIEAAATAWVHNKNIQSSNQQSILDFITSTDPEPKPPPPPPRNIVEEARVHADRGVLRQEQNQPRIRNIFNPAE